MIVRAPNYPEGDYIHYVMERMKRLGPPVLRVVRVPGRGWFAIEGSHRLAAADRLGITPTFLDVTGERSVEMGDGHWYFGVREGTGAEFVRRVERYYAKGWDNAFGPAYTFPMADGPWPASALPLLLR
jgi:hypothetical protein